MCLIHRHLTVLTCLVDKLSNSPDILGKRQICVSLLGSSELTVTFVFSPSHYFFIWTGRFQLLAFLGIIVPVSFEGCHRGMTRAHSHLDTEKETEKKGGKTETYGVFPLALLATPCRAAPCQFAFPSQVEQHQTVPRLDHFRPSPEQGHTVPGPPLNALNDAKHTISLVIGSVIIQ